MPHKTDVLMFVEDPGAANYVARLPSDLDQRGLTARLLAEGAAREYLLRRMIRAERVQCPGNAEAILESEQPRLLLVGTSENPDTLGLALVDAARARGISSVGAVDAESNAEYRFRGRSDKALTHAPDWLLVPDEFTKETYVGLGFAADRVEVCGHPHHDYVRAVAQELARRDRRALRQSVFPGLLPDRFALVFVAEVSTGLAPAQYERTAEYTLIGRGGCSGRTQIVLEEFLDALRGVAPRPYCVLRLHPKNTIEEFAAYLSEFDQVSVDQPPLELIYAADLVVGMTSMLLFEAALMARPTLSIVPRSVEAGWLPSIRMGATPCVTTREKLVAALEEFLGRQPPEVRLVEGEGNSVGSLDRTIAFLEGLLRSEGRVFRREGARPSRLSSPF